MLSALSEGNREARGLAPFELSRLPKFLVAPTTAAPAPVAEKTHFS
jgi:hypothetical protein